VDLKCAATLRVDFTNYVSSGQECARVGRPGAHIKQQLTRPNTPWQLLEFTLTGQISYPMKTEPNEITRKDRMPDENLEGTEDVHSNVGSALRVEGPGLPTPVSPRIPDNIATARKYYSD
jgi:hypothetical protein